MTRMTNDVFVYGKLYAEFGGDVQSFSTAGVERVRIDKEGQVTISGDVLIKDNKKLDDVMVVILLLVIFIFLHLYWW